MPFASTPLPTVAAVLAQVVPVPSPPARVASTLTVTDVWLAPVTVFDVRSLTTPRFTVWSGVIRQEQQATNSSPGSTAYTFTQMFPVAVPKPGPRNAAPLVPSLAISMYDSPAFKLAA